MRDQHQEQISGLACAVGLWKVLLNSILFHATERGIGDDHVNAVFRLIITIRSRERVVVRDLIWRVDAVQHQVSYTEKVWKLLLLDSLDRVLKNLFVFDAVNILTSNM